jgi:hypothetical protein
MDIRPPKLLLELAVAALLIVGAGMFVLGGGRFETAAGVALIGCALVGGVILDQRGAINLGVAIAAAIGTVVAGGVAIVGLFGLAVYLTISGGGSGLTYVNKTTVPIAIVDQGSRSIVGPCSQRTIKWNNSWGGNPSTGLPNAEPMPADAYILSAEGHRPPPDAMPSVTTFITRVQILEVHEGMPDLRDLPCEGTPPGWLSPSEPPVTK